MTPSTGGTNARMIGYPDAPTPFETNEAPRRRFTEKRWAIVVCEVERETRLELATSTLARLRSTN